MTHSSPSPTIRLRPVSGTDLDVICGHREAMFRQSGRSETSLLAMRGAFRAWLETALARGDYSGVMAEGCGGVIGGVGVMVLDWPPHPSHPQQAQRGYILNLFVEPEHRGRGLGAALMAAAETMLSERGVAFAFLHATDQGRPLYLATGWSGTSEMAKSLVDY